MSKGDEGPSKRPKTEDTLFSSEGIFVTDSSKGKEVDAMTFQLRLKPSKMQTWWTHKIKDHPVGDRLLKRRMMILKNKELDLDFSAPRTLPKEGVRELLRDILRAARIIHLDIVELYFAEEEDDWGTFSIRNELEALSSILSSIKSIYTPEYDTQGTLDALLEEVVLRIVSLEIYQGENMKALSATDVKVPTAIVTKLYVAAVEGAGRGLAASEDVQIGDVTLEVPKHLVISDDFIATDEHVYWKTDKLSHSSRRMLWIMQEKKQPRKEFAEFFNLSFPKCQSGAFFCDDAEEVLRGTPLQSVLLGQKEYLKYQFRSEIKPVLKELGQLNDDSFTEFMHAWELWNSCSVSIVFSDEKLRACLLPVACFFNHSQCPHVLYGKYDVSAEAVQFIASRPCMKGEQCFLSYGNFSGAEFITFYGFLPKHLNYHDVVSFELGDNFSEEITLPPKDKRHWPLQMARGVWPYSKKSGLTKGLIKHVEADMKYQDEDVQLKDVYERLMHLFMGINLGLELGSLKLDERQVEKDTRWDVKLASDYRKRYWEVLCHVMTECSNALDRLVD